jgi:hypothetical protein
MSRSRQRGLWTLGAVVFLGVAAVGVSISAWPAVAAATFLAVVQFVIAERLRRLPDPTT